MRAGQLRHKLEICVPTSARGDDGSIETAVSNLGTFYASVRTDNASEVNSDGKMLTYVRHKITFRYNSLDLATLTGDACLSLDGTEIRVLSASVKDYRDRTIEVLAERIE